MAGAAELADVFVTALKSLPKPAREAIIVRIARDKQFAEDILDLTIAETRRREPSRPFQQYLADRKKRR
jgi:hypothetical protein